MYEPKPPPFLFNSMPSQNSNQYLPYNDKPKTSPVAYLIDTEEEYVNDLQFLLHQVTRSWDSNNPMPPELNVMFNSLDKVYNHNNKFFSRIKNIGSVPENPEELGETLIKWVEEMEKPYAAYFQNYRRGIDLWPEVDNNLNLQQNLNSISSHRNQLVTLDYLFEIPLKRIHYYKKLYMRILKNSEPGRPDYDILSAANGRIDKLIELEKRAKTENRPRESIPLPQFVSKTYISPVNMTIGTPDTESSKPINLTPVEFETLLDTSRVVDLFSKQPKTLKIQLSPPHLPFVREIILSDDFIVILPANSQAHVNAHLILFTDLLLVCQQLTPEEKLENPTKNFWLLYPPLSGKYLSIIDMQDNKEDLFNLVISTATESESIVVVANDKKIKDTWILQISQVIEFAKAASARPQINPEPQLSISTQEGTRDFPGRALSPPENLKIGLPSSPRPFDQSRNAGPNSPLLPSRSRSPGPIRNASPPPNSGEYLQIRDGERSNVSSVSSIASFTETIYQTPPCEVSCWVVGEWIPIAKGNCIVELKMTSLNKPCWVVLLESNGRMILNAWIDSITSIQRETSYSISIPCSMGENKEHYLIKSANPMDSDILYSNFLKMKNINTLGVAPVHGFLTRSSSLNSQVSQAREIEQEFIEVMESRVKLFLQNDVGVWTNLGWGNMKLLLQSPHRKRIIIQSNKQKIMVDSFLDESGVQKVNRSSITFKINNIGTASIIYMIQFKDEANVSKAIEIMKTKGNVLS